MRKILISVFSLFFLYLLSAQTDYDTLFKETNKDNSNDTTSISSNDIDKLKFSIDGKKLFEFHMPVIKDHFDFYGEIKAPRFTNDLGVSLKYKTLSVTSNFRLDLKLNDFNNLYNILAFSPLENSIKWSIWKFNFGAGFQYFSWGTADKINPTDNLNPRDYRRGGDAEKIPLLSINTSFFPVDFISIDAVYVPFEQSDLFPVNWKSKIPDAFFYEQGVNVSAFPLLIFYPIKVDSDNQYDNLKFDPSSFIVGGKLNFNLQHADFSFSYLYDVDPYYTPIIKVKRYKFEETPTPIPVDIYAYRVKSIELVRKRLHRFGADLKTTVDRFGLWLELCYTMTEDYLMKLDSIRNHNLYAVAGVDFNYGPSNDFYINLQMIGKFNPLFDRNFYKDYKDGKPDSTKIDDKDYMLQYYYRAITNGLGTVRSSGIIGGAVSFKWPVLNSLLTPAISGSYMYPIGYDYERETRYGSLYLNPELDIMPIDSFHIKIGSNLYYSWKKLKGESVDIDYEDDLGYFYNNNNIYLIVQYKWSMSWDK